MELLKDWFRRSFSDPQVVILGLVLVVGFAVIVGLGKWLAPMFASIVIAYLLEALVSRLQKTGMPRLPSVIIVFLLFMTVLFFLTFGLVPIVIRQLTALVQQFPNYIAQGQELLKQLPEAYPQMISEEQIQIIITQLGQEMAVWGQQALSWSLASVASVIGLVIYLVLVPVLVFFLLKDKSLIVFWIANYLPKERTLVNRVWTESEAQIANYVRGKVTEIVIVGSVTYITFIVLDLDYAALLATLVGFSVLVPYIGAGLGFWPGDHRLRHHPGPGRQSAGAAAVFRGGKHAPRRHHTGHTGFRWALGLLGHLFRDSPGDPGQGRTQCLAAAIRGS